jgi:hypothetical protein
MEFISNGPSVADAAPLLFIPAEKRPSMTSSLV